MIERPAARYGRQRVSRRTRRLVAAVLAAGVVVAGVILAIVASQRLGTQEVEGELGAYRIIDDRTVEVTVSVTREDPSRPAVCIVRARSKDGSETGRREILVPPSEQATVQVTTVVEASKPPVIGDVYGCGLDVPPYLVAP
ncbi:DUF4307 domain-containing protein [Mycolicibacterium monacense]|uniref:Membrane protein n=4 Tax=Mycobacteriaceae TaxID=1762 RepID=A0AAD1IQD9_MYCMB|nr:DUF4307 domain-containing protein [Mycolicibacterium monacense]MDA4101165.1 membrane protein [Mycolicibacterium monacense DSM 44395]OBB67078.1 hypothetical protein A6B34_20990 [Mycolicibacterium monacense]OBF51378.1 hypothetical protein A5778_16725 [Mycolicibacterium monacense]ORB11721.1 hypothetical protein BST34_28285 [Mycolicibacterium monacense DSM 44395]QHP87883.1 DUF4307 domain-containing protein [Mycolicibacterium monacense DSM 44395]